MLPASAVFGQRIQFPSMASDDSIYSTVQAQTFSPGPAGVNPAPSYSPPGGFGAPGQPASPSFAPAADPFQQPAYSPYNPSPYTPVTPAPYGASPYPAAPYNAAPQPLFPGGGPSIFPPGGMFAALDQPIRLLQEVRGRETWLAGIGGAKALTVDDVETQATFAFPIIYQQAPLLVSPGFVFHFFGGPQTQPPDNADLPPRTYDAYLDTAWQPRISPRFSADVGARVGVYSDFHAFTTRSIRVMGRGLGVVSFTPNLQGALGVVYLNRLRVKLLPAGGLIWTPTPDARYEIVFPNPKLARRYTTWGVTDIWWYVSGEYGGGSWTIKRIGGGDDAVDYNDIRIALGLETIPHSGLRSLFEVGYAFDRQLFYRSAAPQFFRPSDTIELRLGLIY